VTLNEIPAGWIKTKLDDVVDVLDSLREPINLSEREQRIKNKPPSALYPYFGSTGQVGWIDDFQIEGESVLLGEDGAPFLDPNKDKAYLVNGQYWVNNHAHILRGVVNGLDNRFLCYQLNTIDYRDFVTGTTRLKLTNTAMKQIPLLLAPYSEQVRIVEKIEEIFSDLNAGVAELNNAQRKLVRYRQSLLKAAVEGQLTATWRAENKTKESEEKFLACILAERRRHWEEKQLAKFMEQGKTPTEDWQDKYPEPVAPDTIDLPELPAGWVWASLSQVGWLDRGRSMHRPRNAPHLFGGPYPFIQTGDIRDADTHINQASSSYSEEGLAQSRLWPQGTLCITIAANIGKTAILGIDACFPDSIVGFLPASDLVSVEYIEYFMRTVQQHLEAAAPATAQKNINLEILARIHLPLPPKNEQIQIVSEVMLALESASRQERANVIGIKQAETQRRNILKAAYSGLLVPQDPNDEPASVLLERINAEQSERAKQPKPRIKKQKVKEAFTPMKKLFDVLVETADWLPTKDAFRHCGVVDGTQTSRVEEVYAELRAIDKSNLLEVRGVGQFQELKLKAGA
jgi:type I restriction enzyme, S subunit